MQELQEGPEGPGRYRGSRGYGTLEGPEGPGNRRYGGSEGTEGPEGEVWRGGGPWALGGEGTGPRTLSPRVSLILFDPSGAWLARTRWSTRTVELYV